MRPTRRAVLKGAGLAALGAAAAGCVGSGRTVRVAVVWSGWELIAFRRVLAAFSNTHQARVDVLSLGNDIAALLSNQATRKSAPDVLFLPRPGLVRDLRGYLQPLSEQLGESYPRGWRQLVTLDGDLFGVWFKSAHKSLVWYRKDLFRQAKVLPPTSWAEWQQLNADLAAAGVAPLSLAAASGWVLTDWFENVLLGLDPTAYRQLAGGGRDWGQPAVRQALTLLGQFWSQPNVLWGGIRTALLTEFEQSVVDVFTHGRAAMVMEGDFVYSVINRLGAKDAEYGFFRFPPLPQGRRPVMVGGDVAVLTTASNDAGRQLIEWLASADAAEVWAKFGGYTSVHAGLGSGAYPLGYPMQDSPTQGGQTLLDEVRYGIDGEIHFDLSDELTGRLSGGEGHGLWAILQAFLRQVGDGADVATAVDQAARTLAGEAAK